MQSQGTKPKARMRGTEKLSLDNYLSFTDSQTEIDLTASLLNQVILMHGFRKIYRYPKKVLIDAVNSIDLMDPCRSTLNDENVSSYAFMTLEEAIKDLADLNWQECSVTSIQTVNSVKHDLVYQNAKASSSKSKPKGSTKRRKLSTQEGVGGDGSAIDAAHGCGGFVGSHAVCSSAVDREGGRSAELVLKKSSNVRNEGDFGATAGDFSESSSTVLSVCPS